MLQAVIHHCYQWDIQKHMRGPDRSREEIEQEKAELSTVLSSRLFTRAPSLAKLLSYLCGKYFDGEIEQIKEYTIAVEFFKREADFESKESPIVRVEAGRLRAKLKEYYRTEGRNHPLQIHIASGQYAPVFQHHKARQIPPGENDKEDAGIESQFDPNGDRGLHPEEAALIEGGAGHAVAAPAASARTANRWPRGLYVSALAVAGLALAITASILSYRFLFRANAPPTHSAASAGLLPPAPVVPEGSELRIIAGANEAARYVDALGRVWVGDRYYTGGELFTPSAAALQRAEDSIFCKQARQGDFEYNIPLSPGIYELHLYFAEMQYGFEPVEGGETSRIFHVFANDMSLLDSLDIFSDAGGGGRVYERVFTDICPSQDGQLHLSFRSSVKGKAVVNGLEILPGIQGKMRPVRITTRASAYLSSDQQLWQPDRYFRGGRTVVRLRQVEATSDPDLYQSERYGNFTYTIPVAKGRYRLTLKFAETYLGTPNPLHVGPTRRLFDVYCNGQTLLKDFEIAREAGGGNRSLDRTFRGIQPNAQGKIVLTFLPVVNYACINAIEINPE